jgi:aryl-alcohol dehydrogenase
MYCTDFFAYNFASSRPADGSSVLSRNGAPVHAHFFGQSSFATHAVGREGTIVKLPDDVPFEVAAPFGCGIQTGAGSVLNVFNPAPGSSIAVFGAGAVGLSAVLAAKLAGCSDVIVVDLRPKRLELAQELGATAVVDASAHEPARAIRKLTRRGVDFSLEASGSPEAARAAAHCVAHTGVCGIVGAPAVGTEMSLDINTILVGGRVVRGIIEGDSIPSLFLPRLFSFWQEGRFPVERLMTFYDFDDIEQAAHDAASGDVIKPVLRMS